jgi:prephenate dehydrogenase
MTTAASIGPILITGLGLMGGSLAAALSRAGVPVLLHHHRHEVAEAAAARGWGTPVVDFPAAARARIAVVCTPVSIIAATVRALAADTGAMITDVGSTKGTLCAELQPLAQRFLGSHPMCGSHLQGLAHADAELYRQRLTLVTPRAETPPALIAAIEGLWQAVGSRTQRLTPEAHDRVVAEASHLPHILASVTASLLSAEAAPVCASGFRDATRIAGGAPELWLDILLANREALFPLLARSRERLANLEAVLSANDAPALKEWLATGKAGRQLFEDAQS